MKKAILIGSAPTVDEELTKLNIKEFDIICGINNVYHDKVQQLYKKHNIEIKNLDIYFISKYYYDQIPNKVEAIGFKKIIYAIPFQQLRQQTYKHEHIPSELAAKCNLIGGYSGSGWATSGMLALTYLLENNIVDFVQLVGFTFGKGKLHYYESGVLDPQHHNPSKEEIIYNHYFKQGKVIK